MWRLGRVLIDGLSVGCTDGLDVTEGFWLSDEEGWLEIEGDTLGIGLGLVDIEGSLLGRKDGITLVDGC